MPQNNLRKISDFRDENFSRLPRHLRPLPSDPDGQRGEGLQLPPLRKLRSQREDLPGVSVTNYDCNLQITAVIYKLQL